MESNKGRCNICGDTFVAGGDLTHRTSDYHIAAVREYESVLLSLPPPCPPALTRRNRSTAKCFGWGSL